MTISPQTVMDIVGNDLSKKAPSIKSASTWFGIKWQELLAELVSTTLLIWLGCMACVPGEEPVSSLHIPFTFGLLIMANLQIFGHISGAHMNPAVTLAAVIWGKTSIATGVVYVIVQCIGAILGYGILTVYSHGDVSAMGVCVTVPNPNLNAYHALGVEFSVTLILALLLCAIWDPVNHDKHDSAPLKFGLAITALAIVSGPLTGGGINPARSLGPAVWTGIWTAHWVYWVGPLLGSAVATILYKTVWL